MEQKSIPLPESIPGNSRGVGILDEDPRSDLVGLLGILWMRRAIILGTAATVVALVTIFVNQITPMYSATAVVILDERKNSVEASNSVLSGLPADLSTVQNQVQILTSLKLAGRVVDKLKLDRDPEFNPSMAGWSHVLKSANPRSWLPADQKLQAEAQGIDLARRSVLRNFLGRLSVNLIGLSTAMNVTFESEDPAKAAMIANAIANAYVEDQLETKFDATQKATKWLTGRIAELSKQAQAADAAVQSYKAAHHITQSPSGVSVIDQQIADINAQLVIAKMGLAEKQASYSQLVGLARAGQAANSAQVLASPLIGALRAQEAELARQIADLSTKYGPRHP